MIDIIGEAHQDERRRTRSAGREELREPLQFLTFRRGAMSPSMPRNLMLESSASLEPFHPLVSTSVMPMPFGALENGATTRTSATRSERTSAAYPGPPLLP
jgi:hypothetical protein